METSSTKNHRVSFTEEQKETFLRRLRELVNGRPLQQAADVWHIPKSTLNNYFYRGSHPRIDIIQQIASKEGVSAEWLLAKCDTKTNGEKKETSEVTQEKKLDEDLQIISLLNMVSQEDKKALLKGILEIGIKGVLSRLQQPDDQRSQPERKYTKEEQEAMLRALPISERAKNTASLVLALGDDAQKEIFEILEDFKRRIAPEGNADNTAVTPDPSLKQKAG
ncbi:hypothetical protein EWN99_24370 [Salmonella enterica]|nr:hypothetical protein [Salmonella enterica]EDL3627779.1 hypothetical protein [Salmonella enterica subsp. enterica serovar Newport]EGU8718211.1 hypothetical protein [Salmonella enterica]